jgi:hypothetical protein
MIIVNQQHEEVKNMRITRATHSYNERRYGKPWIAKIVITTANPKGDFIWGTWIGDARKGGEGELILDNIEPGDIYARGQKDNRKPRNSSPDYYVLGEDSEGITCGSIIEAKKVSEEMKNTAKPKPDAMDDLASMAC